MATASVVQPPITVQTPAAEGSLPAPKTPQDKTTGKVAKTGRMVLAGQLAPVGAWLSAVGTFTFSIIIIGGLALAGFHVTPAVVLVALGVAAVCGILLGIYGVYKMCTTPMCTPRSHTYHHRKKPSGINEP